MGRGPLSFKHTDIVRAVRALQASGLDVVRTDIAPDGRVSIFHRLDAKPVAAEEETYDQWKARTGASAS